MEIRIIKNAPGVVYEDVSEEIVLQVTEGRDRARDTKISFMGYYKP